jgi:ATP-dependent DNA helicase RecQ
MEAIVWPYPCGISLLAVSEGETMRSVLNGENTRSVMAVSDGKLAIYESAAMVLRGPTLVISPLIAVPRDQADTITRSREGDPR